MEEARREDQTALRDCARRSLVDSAGRALGDLEVTRQRDDPLIHDCHDEACGELHNRMPVILPPDTWPAWLGEEPAEPDQLKALLVPYAGEMTRWPVSQRVGNAKNNDASLIEPVA